MAGAEHLWAACVGRLRSEVPDSTWNTWLAEVRPWQLEGYRLVVKVPSAVAKERIEARWLDRFEQVLAELTGHPHELVLEVGTDAAPPDEAPRSSAAASPPPAPPPHDEPDTPLPTNPPGQPAPTTERAESTTWSGLPWLTQSQAVSSQLGDSKLNPKFTFDDFVIGSSNRFAHAAALAVAEQPAKSWNPLFIYGRTGLGKTHLLHAIAHYVNEHYSSLNVRYVSTETFLNEFVDAIRTNAMSAFKKRYRECHVLLIDDVQFIENKERFQEEFFHTFDHLHSLGRQIVISSDRAPHNIATLEERLRSRFQGGLITDVHPPDLETRLAILRKWAGAQPVPIPDEVLAYIANHITDNIRELEGALLRASAYASLNRVALSPSVAEEVLGQLIGGSDSRRITPKMILDATSEMFGHPVEELCGKSRSRPLVQARQVGMYVFRELTDFSYPAIGRVFGNRDHTTVMHAVEKISQLMAERRITYDQVTALIHRIRSGG
ncbi:MAG: chromosomal replication initiator protein DnaA [Actinomycetota bacterium]|nr:chromosomal replication initiator protein DnaA [Actinomycetota bacterium]